MKIRTSTLLLFCLILFIGLYLRFNNFEGSFFYTYDQGRDAWKVRDILSGQLVIDGPRTGVGHFNLVPTWFYMLVPFYYFSRMDPIAASYLNFLVNIFNFSALFYVSSRIWSRNSALFILLLYATSSYLIETDRIPWNVTPVVGISMLIFYGITQVYKNKFNWIPTIFLLLGILSTFHVQFVFFIGIIPLSFIYLKRKREALLKALYSLPLFLIWLVPLFFPFRQHSNTPEMFQNFISNNILIHPSVQLILGLRLSDSFVQFQTILFRGLPQSLILKLCIPLIFALTIWFEKNKTLKLQSYLISLWFVVPLLFYSFYKGSTSEYYVIMTAPMVIFIVYLLQKRVLENYSSPLVRVALVLLWSLFVIKNTNGLWQRSNTGGLKSQKQIVKTMIQTKSPFRFAEGDISSYMYQVYLDKQK